MWRLLWILKVRIREQRIRILLLMMNLQKVILQRHMCLLLMVVLFLKSLVIQRQVQRKVVMEVNMMQLPINIY